MGLLTLKRQNLTNLLPYALDNFRNLYIFKGGGANTIGTVFNKDDFIKDDFASLADRLRIFSPDLTTSINYYVRFTENRWTRSNPTNPDATNVVIAENSPIQILTDSNPSLNLPKSINNGAIIQRYYQGKTSIKKQNLGGGKISLYKAPPIFITFGQSLVLNNLPFDADGNCNFSVFNRTWIYLDAPNFRYRPIDSLSYFINTPLTPEGYGGNGSYQIASSDEVYFTNGYSNSDKFPSNNWQLAPYIINNCSQITTTPIFSLL